MQHTTTEIMKKRILKWTIGILSVPIVLFFIVAALLYLPPVQDFAVRKATVFLSESTGMKIHVGRLRLAFLFDIDLQDVQVADEQGDCLLNVERLNIDLSFRSLLRGEIDVEGIELTRASVDTKSLITGVGIKGRIGQFFVDSHGIRLPQETVTVNNIRLADADVHIALNDSVKEDTTSSTPLNWNINIIQTSLERTHLFLSMPGDSMTVEAGIATAHLQQGNIDLKQSLYTVGTFDLHADSLYYDLPFETTSEGLDVNHIALKDIGIGIDSIYFDGQSTGLSLLLRETRMKEKSGLEISSLNGRLHMDSTSLHVSELSLHTPDSYLGAQAHMDFSAVGPHPHGSLSARLMGELGKQDVLLFAGGLPMAFVRSYPNEPIIVRLSADGNLDSLNLTTAEARLAGAFELKADGRLRQLTDSVRMSGDINLDLRTQNLNFVKTLAGPGAMKDIALPPMHLTGKAGMYGRQYTTDLWLREGKGNVRLKGGFDASRMSYQAGLSVKDLQLHHFLPKDSLYDLSLTAKAEGRGFDPFSRQTRMNADLKLDRLQYGQLHLDNINLNAALKQGNGHAMLDSHNPLLNMTSRIDALLARKKADMTFSIDLRSIDLHALHLTDKPFKAGMCLHADGSTNLKNAHTVHGTISDIHLILKDTLFHPKDLAMNVLALPDTTYADISAGDFKLHLDGRDGYETLARKSMELMAATNEQLQRRHLNQDSLKTLLPRLTLNVTSGKENPVANYMAALGYSFHELDLNLNTDPTIGVNGKAHIYTINAGGILLDTVQAQIFQDSTGIKMNGKVRNNPKNKQFVFESRLNAYLHATGAGAELMYLDDKRRKGVDLGLRADLTDNGVKMVFSQTHPILAYRTFDINEDNYIFLGNDKRIEADISMKADDGTSIKIFSTPNAEALQDISVNLNNVNLGELTAVIPYAPHITGLLQTDAHLIQTTENLSVVADTYVKDMAYEEAPVGDIGMGLVYLPNSDGTHFVDARVSHNNAEVMTLSGSYRDDDKDGIIEADLDLADFPLSMANGFIPDHLATLEGMANGCMKVEGPTSRPDIEGWLATKGLKIVSPEYSLNLRLQDDTIKVTRNRLNLDRLNMYSTGKNPLVFDGTVDFADFENILLNLKVNASNFELINARRTQQAAAYGKVYVDISARMTGNLNNININGRLGVLGSTDVTYVLKDSPLSSEDRLSGLVTFVDFSDTTSVAEHEEVRPVNMNMMMRINIDQGTQVHCLLSPDRSKYIDLEGGGELTMNYTPQGEMTLTGRYTVLNGEMKYSLPVIPLKTFTIASGSYVDFTGPILNPTLNISASERMRATVTENETPRTVAFNVGLSITRTLENMGLEFTIDAPEDMTVQNQLAAMSAEERGKVAVTMLATGMYLKGDNETGGFSTSNALNALLQSEITNIAGKALETIDLSLGVDQETTAEGTERTDYSFRFAKRFWGNRVSIIVGGKVSTGENVENTGQSLIDNISLEYRLDKSATRYVTVFYDKSYESLLEGEITEMGAGLVLRRKMTRLGELFIFRNKKKNEIQHDKEE